MANKHFETIEVSIRKHNVVRISHVRRLIVLTNTNATIRTQYQDEKGFKSILAEQYLSWGGPTEDQFNY